MAEIVDEGSTAYLTVLFKGKDGSPEAPASIKYSIWCLTNAQEVRAETEIAAGKSVEITLTPDDNAILSQANGREERLVTVRASYGANDDLNREFRYLVRNLTRVS